MTREHVISEADVGAGPGFNYGQADIKASESDLRAWNPGADRRATKLQ